MGVLEVGGEGGDVGQRGDVHGVLLTHREAHFLFVPLDVRELG